MIETWVAAAPPVLDTVRDLILPILMYAGGYRVILALFANSTKRG